MPVATRSHLGESSVANYTTLTGDEVLQLPGDAGVLEYLRDSGNERTNPWLLTAADTRKLVAKLGITPGPRSGQQFGLPEVRQACPIELTAAETSLLLQHYCVTVSTRDPEWRNFDLNLIDAGARLIIAAFKATRFFYEITICMDPDLQNFLVLGTYRIAPTSKAERLFSFALCQWGPDGLTIDNVIATVQRAIQSNRRWERLHGLNPKHWSKRRWILAVVLGLLCIIAGLTWFGSQHDWFSSAPQATTASHPEPSSAQGPTGHERYGLSNNNHESASSGSTSTGSQGGSSGAKQVLYVLMIMVILAVGFSTVWFCIKPKQQLHAIYKRLGAASILVIFGAIGLLVIGVFGMVVMSMLVN